LAQPPNASERGTPTSDRSGRPERCGERVAPGHGDSSRVDLSTPEGAVAAIEGFYGLRNAQSAISILGPEYVFHPAHPEWIHFLASGETSWDYSREVEVLTTMLDAGKSPWIDQVLLEISILMTRVTSPTHAEVDAEVLLSYLTAESELLEGRSRITLEYELNCLGDHILVGETETVVHDTQQTVGEVKALALSSDYDAIHPVVYSRDLVPIISRSCSTMPCHSVNNAAAGLSLADYDDLAKGSRFGAIATPFAPGFSQLYLTLTGSTGPSMPFGQPPLPSGAVRMFHRWIDSGARADDGSILYSDVARKAFVSCQGENTIAVVDIETHRLARLLAVDTPHSLLVDTVARRLYVSRLVTASDNVHVYDAETYELVTSGRAGTFPAMMALSSDRSQLWVTNFTGFGDDDNAVRVLDPTTLEEIVPGGITAPSVEQPHGVAVASSSRFVYVTNILTDNVSVLSQDPIGFDTLVPLPAVPGRLQQPLACKLAPAEDYLYVSALGSDRVYVMRVSDHAFVATVQTGDAPWHLTVSPDGSQLWVANWLGSSVTVINVTNPESPVVVEPSLAPANPVDGVRPAVMRPIGIAFSPDGTEVYVTSANDDDGPSGHYPPPAGEKNPGLVTVFDPATRQVVSVTEVPNFARFVDFLP
jgi:YVTN family beta-propeller protein